MRECMFKSLRCSISIPVRLLPAHRVPQYKKMSVFQNAFFLRFSKEIYFSYYLWNVDLQQSWRLSRMSQVGMTHQSQWGWAGCCRWGGPTNHGEVEQGVAGGEDPPITVRLSRVLRVGEALKSTLQRYRPPSSGTRRDSTRAGGLDRARKWARSPRRSASAQWALEPYTDAPLACTLGESEAFSNDVNDEFHDCNKCVVISLE